MRRVADRFSVDASRWLAVGVLALVLSACSGGGNAPQGGTAYYPSMSFGPGGPPPGQGGAVGYRPSVSAPAAPVRDPYFISSTPQPGAGVAPSIRAASYLLIDARTGAHLASRNSQQRRAVASIQKLVTALVVLDAGDLDRMVTIASTDVAVEPSRLGVKPGERYTRKTLLYAFLIKSSNDVAKALARDNAGSSAAFAQKMNAKMRQLGAMNSNFVNPHGLTEPGQYSTAMDMARMAMAAYQNRLIRDAVARKYYSFTYSSTGRTATLENTNKLLGNLAACNGMKTGYTVASGRTLISSAAMEGRNVILVQLGSKTSYIFDDARTLMTWGLRQLGARSVAAGGPTTDPVMTLPNESLLVGEP